MTKAMDLTVTQKLRIFLARSGQAVAPWSSVEEVMDRLYALLYDRREHEGVWRELAALLDSIQSETHGMLPAPDAEILSRSRVDTLVAELRRAVRASAEAPAAGAMRRFALGKSASVLACIALLAAGFSLGCGSSSESKPDVGGKADTANADTAKADAANADTPLTPDTTPSGNQDTAPTTPDTPLGADTTPAEAKDVAVPDQPTTGPVDAAAVDVPADGPKDAGVSEAGKALDGGAIDAVAPVDALIDLFRDGRPEDIAAKLEASVSDSPRYLPDIAVVYKGVAFPTG
jgi:hypothetical protein